MNRRVRFSSASALVLSLLALVAGCGAEPTAPTLRPDGLRVGEVAQAVWAPVVVPAGLYARHIGPEGGTLYFGIGSLSFPRGALTRTTYITAAVDGFRSGVDFGPEGVSFPASARPTLGFRVGSVTNTDGLQVLYLDDDGRILSLLPTSVQSSEGLAVARLDHFSPYILAQN